MTTLGDAVEVLLSPALELSTIACALDGKRVLHRLDLNLPLAPDSSGALRVQDDTRLRAALPSVKALLAAGARVALCSHLGRPEPSKQDAAEMRAAYSLSPVADVLAEQLGDAFVGLVPDCVGPEAAAAVQRLQPGQVRERLQIPVPTPHGVGIWPHGVLKRDKKPCQTFCCCSCCSLNVHARRAYWRISGSTTARLPTTTPLHASSLRLLMCMSMMPLALHIATRPASRCEVVLWHPAAAASVRMGVCMQGHCRQCALCGSMHAHMHTHTCALLDIRRAS
jgi:Phosphoglycerate kinase